MKKLKFKSCFLTKFFYCYNYKLYLKNFVCVNINKNYDFEYIKTITLELKKIPHHIFCRLNRPKRVLTYRLKFCSDSNFEKTFNLLYYLEDHSIKIFLKKSVRPYFFPIKCLKKHNFFKKLKNFFC